MAINLKVNGSRRSVPAEADTPLLYVLRNDLALNGPKFGCGLAQCGACRVLIDGRAVRSCVTEIGSIGDAEITTIEGLWTIDNPHPLQRAFIDEQAAQCGYCIYGRITTALVQIAAEELDLPLARVRLISGDTAGTPDEGHTSGSVSIENGGTAIRLACAEARALLVDHAAKRLGLAAEALSVNEGIIA